MEKKKCTQLGDKLFVLDVAQNLFTVLLMSKMIAGKLYCVCKRDCSRMYRLGAVWKPCTAA